MSRLIHAPLGSNSSIYSTHQEYIHGSHWNMEISTHLEYMSCLAHRQCHTPITYMIEAVTKWESRSRCSINCYLLWFRLTWDSDEKKIMRHGVSPSNDKGIDE